MPLKIPPELVTPRLRVRSVTNSDLAALMAVNGDEAVTKFLPYSAWRTLDDARAWLKRMRRFEKTGLSHQFVVVEKTREQAIGTCLIFAFEESNRQAELGFALGREWWGTGYMTEALVVLIDRAFSRMGVRRFIAHADAGNSASCALLKRLGFTKEGTLRDRWLVNGKPRNAEVYGLLKREWPARKPSRKSPQRSQSRDRSPPRSRRGA